MGQYKQRIRAFRRLHQFLGIGQGRGQRFVANHMNAALQKFTRSSEVYVVRGHDGHRLDPVLQTGLADRHRFEIVIDARQAQRFTRGLRLFRGRGQRPSNQFKPIVYAGGNTVHATDKGIIAATHHT